MSNSQAGGAFVKKSGDTMTGNLDMGVGLTVDGIDISAANYLTFVDRGDIANYDWDKDGLTTDGNYHDLDLSSIIPVGTKLVMFRVIAASAGAGQSFGIKEKGNSNAPNVFKVYCTEPGSGHKEDGFVVPDANRKVEYAASDIVWGVLDVAVVGWFV